MEKSVKYILLSLIFLFILNIFIINLKAQDPPMPSIPVPGVGNVNEEGLATSFEKFQQASEQLSEEESRKEFLKQKWSIILADNKVVGPALFYTERFFSALNPVWNLIFQIEFSWSWGFILSLFIFISFIVIIYSSIKAFTGINAFLVLLISFIITTLIGIAKGINEGVKILSSFLINIWIFLAIFLILALIVYLYKVLMDKIGKNLKEKGKERKEEMREMKEATKEKITNIKLKGEGL